MGGNRGAGLGEAGSMGSIQAAATPKSIRLKNGKLWVIMQDGTGHEAAVTAYDMYVQVGCISVSHEALEYIAKHAQLEVQK